MNSNVIKVLGIVASVIGIGATLLSDWVGDKKLDNTVTEKVAEALKKMNEES